MGIGFNPTGVEVADELVAITTATTLAGSPVYYGTLRQRAGADVVGQISATHGFWSGAGRTGTRYSVIAEGVPVSGEVRLDVQKGIVYSPSSISAYASYLGLGEIAETRQAVEIGFGGLLLPSTIQVLGYHHHDRPTPITFTHAEVTVAGNPSFDNDVVIAFIKNLETPVSGTFTLSTTRKVTLGTSARRSGILPLLRADTGAEASLEMVAGDYLTVATPGGDSASGLTVRLFELRDRQLA